MLAFNPPMAEQTLRVLASVIGTRGDPAHDQGASPASMLPPASRGHCGGRAVGITAHPKGRARPA
jgi:hypothetical protein